MNETSRIFITLINGTIPYSLEENENDLDRIHIYLPEFELVIHTGLFYYNDIVAIVKTYNDVDLNQVVADLNKQLHLLRFIPSDQEIEIHAQISSSLLKNPDCERRALKLVFYELLERYQLAIPYVIKRINDNKNG